MLILNRNAFTAYRELVISFPFLLQMSCQLMCYHRMYNIAWECILKLIVHEDMYNPHYLFTIWISNYKQHYILQILLVWICVSQDLGFVNECTVDIKTFHPTTCTCLLGQWKQYICLIGKSLVCGNYYYYEHNILTIMSSTFHLFCLLLVVKIVYLNWNNNHNYFCKAVINKITV